MSSLTGYVFDEAVLERIALERGVDEVKQFSELTQRNKDLILADMLLVLFTSPSHTASFSKKHGQFSQTIGSQAIYNKDEIYELMMRLYNRWGDPKADDFADMGGLEWLEM